APELLREVPAEVRFVLGDRHYNTPDLRQICECADRLLVTTKYGRYPHTDDGVEVRRIFHKLRSIAMENFNEHFKGIFDGHGQVPTKGLLPTQRFALGAILVYQLPRVAQRGESKLRRDLLDHPFPLHWTKILSG